MTFQPSNRRYQGAFLPHTDAAGRPQMITCRLADSLPRRVFQRLVRQASNHEQRKALFQQYFDRGRGACLLRHPEAAQIVIEAFKYYAGDHYRLIDWVVMPNHIHVVYDEPTKKVGKILKNWKGYTASQINKALDRSGQFWQRDYFDRYARDPIHLYNMSCYVMLNPVKAGLVDDPFEWPYSSIHDYRPEFKDDLRRWYRRWKSRFWRSVGPDVTRSGKQRSGAEA